MRSGDQPRRSGSNGASSGAAVPPATCTPATFVTPITGSPSGVSGRGSDPRLAHVAPVGAVDQRADRAQDRLETTTVERCVPIGDLHRARDADPLPRTGWARPGRRADRTGPRALRSAGRRTNSLARPGSAPGRPGGVPAPVATHPWPARRHRPGAAAGARCPPAARRARTPPTANSRTLDDLTAPFAHRVGERVEEWDLSWFWLIFLHCVDGASPRQDPSWFSRVWTEQLMSPSRSTTVASVAVLPAWAVTDPAAQLCGGSGDCRRTGLVRSAAVPGFVDEASELR